MQKDDGILLLPHSGNIWGATAFTAIDEHGGVTTWAGTGSPGRGSDDFDRLRWSMYENAHYRALGNPSPGS